MIKYILPAIIIFLIVLFWEKITDFVEKKFNIKLNYIVVSSIVAAIGFMNRIDLSTYKLDEADGVFTYKNENTTLGFVRFNEKGEVEYIFVNPIFRKKGIAKKLLQLVKQKTGKEIILQEPISPLGSKLLNSLNKWK
jgi:GNAT superfamily N-acetyltransferase